jgi:hypothetical protein
MERPKGGDGAVPVPDISTGGGEAFAPGDATQNACNFSSTDMNFTYALDLAALMSGMLPQDQEIGPLDDIYYW